MNRPPHKKEFKHKCELRLLVCEPNPFRPDRVTVGFVLRDINGETPRVEVRLAQNLDSIQCVYPDADVDAIKGLLLEMEPVLRSVTDFDKYLENLPSDGTTVFSFLPGSAVLTDSMETEVNFLNRQYLASLAPNGPQDGQKSRKERTADFGRAYILRKMEEVFVQFDVSKHLSRDISVEDHTFKGDSLAIDFGYLNRVSNYYRMMHAVSLVTNLDRAKILGLSWPLIRDGMNKVKGNNPELFAIVEDRPYGVDPKAQAARGWMEQVGIRVETVSSVMLLAAKAKLDLQL